MPESSLAQMISSCVEEFGNGVTLCAAGRERIAASEARCFLVDAVHAGEPVCILGTTAAFATLFAHLDEAGASIRLPKHSRMMDTGGAKGQATPLGAEDLVAAAERWLGIDPALAINEYGMTEMCSQLYDLTRFNCNRDCRRDELVEPVRPPPMARGRRPKLGPPWLRTSAVDPVTLRRVPDGTIGLLSFLDLANVGSVSALITEDFGIVEGDRVFVLGRASAEARGCALGIGEFAAIEASAPRRYAND